MDGDDLGEELRFALERAGRGDAAALKEIYDRTSATLSGICLRILGDRSETEDVLQEVYLSIWRHSAAYDPTRASPVAWMAMIARRRSIDRLRARRPGRLAPLETALDVMDEAPSAVVRVVLRQDSARLDACIKKLEHRQREAIRAAFLDGFTYEALARREGVPLGTMKSWIRRGLANLRACMDM